MARVTTSPPVEPEVVITLSMREAVALCHVFGNSIPDDLSEADVPNLYNDLERAIGGYVDNYDYHEFGICNITRRF